MRHFASARVVIAATPDGSCFCTICCKRKRRGAAPLPALQRYLSRRIRFVHALSRRHGLPLRILSGRFGLLSPDQQIPYYDQPLSASQVDALVPRVATQLATARVKRLVFFARPRATPGWRPYYDLLERACRRQRIRLEVQLIGPQFI